MNIKLVIFDKDGTLVRLLDKKTNRTANKPEEQVLLPGRLKKIRALRERGIKITFVSNQERIAWGLITEIEAAALMADVARKIGWVPAWRVCPHDPQAAGAPNARSEYAVPCKCRRPAPGMLLELMDVLRAAPEETLFVGDMEEDRLAAQAAGCHFMWADEFFGPKSLSALIGRKKRQPTRSPEDEDEE